jgi:hypothetical protein
MVPNTNDANFANYRMLFPSNTGGSTTGGMAYYDDLEVWDGCPTTLTFGGGTPSCASGPDTTPPSLSAGAPSGALSAGTTSTEIRLTATDATTPITCKWDTSDVAYASMGSTMDDTGCSGGSTHCDTYAGLSDGNTYHAYVRCQDSVDPTPNVNTSSLHIQFSVASGNIPATPTGLNITSTATMSLGLGWNSSSGATGYRLYECHTSGSCTPTVELVDQVGTSYSHVTLVPGTGYRYAVTAYNGDGESSASSVVTGTTSQVGIAASYPQDIDIGTDGRVVWVEDFEEASIANLTARYTDFSNSAVMSFQSNIPADAVPGSQSVRFTEGAGSTPHLWKEFSGSTYDQLFLRYYVRYITGVTYDGHSSVWLMGMDPLQGYPFPQAGTCNIDGRQIASYEPVASGFDAYLYWPAMHESSPGECYGNDIFGVNSFLSRDVWHSVEVMVKLNSSPYSTTNDGEYAVWVDGVKVGHYGEGFPTGSWSGDSFTPGGGTPFEGFRWRVSEDPYLNVIWIQNYLPNTGSNGHLDYDQLVVATEYIGPLAAGGDTTPPAAPTNLRVVHP